VLCLILSWASGTLLIGDIYAYLIVLVTSVALLETASGPSMALGGDTALVGCDAFGGEVAVMTVRIGAPIFFG
jgi:hypothetical protein